MKSLEELKALKAKMQDQMGSRDIGSDMTRVVVGMATCGIASGARPVLNKLAAEVRSENLERVMVTQTGCIGLCQYEPIVEIFEPGKPKVTYIKMTEERAEKIVHQHLVNGNVVEEYTLASAQKLK